MKLEFGFSAALYSHLGLQQYNKLHLTATLEVVILILAC